MEKIEFENETFARYFLCIISICMDDAWKLENVKQSLYCLFFANIKSALHPLLNQKCLGGLLEKFLNFPLEIGKMMWHFNGHVVLALGRRSQSSLWSLSSSEAAAASSSGTLDFLSRVEMDCITRMIVMMIYSLWVIL